MTYQEPGGLVVQSHVYLSHTVPHLGAGNGKPASHSRTQQGLPPTASQAGTSVMAIFFLSKDSRICCSSLWVGRSSVGPGTCSLLPRPSPSPQGPPGTAAQRTLPPDRALAAATAAQVPCLPGAGCWLTRGTVGKPPGHAQGCGQLEVLLHGSGAVHARLPRPGLCSPSARHTEAGTAALAPGGPPAAPEGPGSAFSGVKGHKERVTCPGCFSGRKSQQVSLGRSARQPRVMHSPGCGSPAPVVERSALQTPASHPGAAWELS